MRSAREFLGEVPEGSLGVITMLDILEHFTRAEMFELLSAVATRLAPGGRLIASVPNASSPRGLHTYFADITHETTFTPASLMEVLFCHGLTVRAIRDPWPAPVTPLRSCYRALSRVAQRLEGWRLRLLGLDVPEYWSSVIWALAVKV